MLELNVCLLELLEDLVLGHKCPVVVHDLLHLLLAAVLDRPVLELGLCESHESHDAALVLQELQLDRPHLSLGSNSLQSDFNGLKLLSWHLANQLAIPHSCGKLLLDSSDISEEGLVVLNLLVEDGSRLLIKLGWDIISVNESLATKRSRTCSCVHAEAWSQWYNGATDSRNVGGLKRWKYGHHCTTVMPDNRHRATATNAYLYSYLALVQPLSDLPKVSRQTGVKQPLPVTNLVMRVVLVLKIG